MLMSASDNPKKDREIFLKILTMDDDGTWQRCKGEIPVAAWREYEGTSLSRVVKREKNRRYDSFRKIIANSARRSVDYLDCLIMQCC